MKNKRDASLIADGFWLFMALGALAVVLVVGFYILKFAGHSLELSASQEVWGQFGDYVGGLLNPIFSFLAFIGVLLTVFLQAKQLDIARDQAHFEELQRMLNTIAKNIDGMLNQTPAYYAAKGYIREDLAPLTLFDHISGFGTDLLRPSEERSFENSFNEHGVQGLREDIAMNIRALSLEFHSLGWAMEKYIGAGGNETITEFYRFRYGAVVTWLDAMGEINATSRIRSVMDLPLLKRAMTDTEFQKPSEVS